MKQIYNARRTNIQRNMNPLSIRKTNKHIIAQSLIVATSVLDSSMLIIASQLRLSRTLLMLRITVFKMSDYGGVGLLGCRTIGMSDYWGVGLLGCRTIGAEHRHSRNFSIYRSCIKTSIKDLNATKCNQIWAQNIPYIFNFNYQF